jgi:hypothetical protein
MLIEEARRRKKRSPISKRRKGLFMKNGSACGKNVCGGRNSYCMSVRPHRGSGSPQIFRDDGERGIGDDELPKSLIVV